MIQTEQFKNKKIYVTGHKSPDTDSVCSAIALAGLLNALGIDACAAVSTGVNNETKLALECFDVPEPSMLGDAGGKSLILVDHNSFLHAPDNIRGASILVYWIITKKAIYRRMESRFIR